MDGTKWGPQTIAKLAQITPIFLWFMVPITMWATPVIIDWIGLREILQENIDFPIKYKMVYKIDGPPQ